MTMFKSLPLKKLLYTLLFAAFMNIPVLAFAEGGDDIIDPDFSNTESPAEVPIDGGLSLLIAAGIGYGVKKAHAARKLKGRERSI